ncbi:MAG: hypothetical protein ACP5G2_02610 [Candidatus Bipolaricaulaceae bacterium]
MPQLEEAKALVVLPPAAARRIIARGVAALPQVQRALAEGLVVVTLGSTNAYVAEELTGRPVAKARFCAGYVGEELAAVPAEERSEALVLRNGRPDRAAPPQVVAELAAGDVLVKGANLLDPRGACGVFMGSPTGGTVGTFAAAALARGVEVVIPISRAKSVHSHVADLAPALGMGRLRRTSGLPVGLFPLMGRVMSEVEAVELLFGVRTKHVASDGVRPGTVVLLVSGEAAAVDRAFAELTALAQAEPPLEFPGAHAGQPG